MSDSKELTISVRDSEWRRFEICNNHNLSPADLGAILRLAEWFGTHAEQVYAEWLEENRRRMTLLHKAFADFVKEKVGQGEARNYDLIVYAREFVYKHTDSKFADVNSLVRQWYRDHWDEIKNAVKEGGAQ